MILMPKILVRLNVCPLQATSGCFYRTGGIEPGTGRREKKRDRQIENTIFFVGTAIGDGQIFCAAYPLIKDTPIKWQLDFSQPLHPFAATILWSLLFGLGFGLLTLLILWLSRKIFPK